MIFRQQVNLLRYACQIYLQRLLKVAHIKYVLHKASVMHHNSSMLEVDLALPCSTSRPLLDAKPYIRIPTPSRTSPLAICCGLA